MTLAFMCLLNTHSVWYNEMITRHETHAYIFTYFCNNWREKRNSLLLVSWNIKTQKKNVYVNYVIGRKWAKNVEAFRKSIKYIFQWMFNYSYTIYFFARPLQYTFCLFQDYISWYFCIIIQFRLLIISAKLN